MTGTNAVASSSMNRLHGKTDMSFTTLGMPLPLRPPMIRLNASGHVNRNSSRSHFSWSSGSGDEYKDDDGDDDTDYYHDDDDDASSAWADDEDNDVKYGESGHEWRTAVSPFAIPQSALAAPLQRQRQRQADLEDRVTLPPHQPMTRQQNRRRQRLHSIRSKSSSSENKSNDDDDDDALFTPRDYRVTDDAFERVMAFSGFTKSGQQLGQWAKQGNVPEGLIELLSQLDT